MKQVLLYATLVLGGVACTSEDSLTQPVIPREPSLAAAATAANSWSTRAAYPGQGLYGGSAAMAANPAGQSIVYLLGGTDGEGRTGFPVQAYNVATNTWSTKTSSVGVFLSNGAGKIGSKIYFSGGYNAVDNPSSFTNLVWAYDYTRDRMIRKANLPIFSAERATGVIAASSTCCRAPVPESAIPTRGTASRSQPAGSSAMIPQPTRGSHAHRRLTFIGAVPRG